MSLDARYTIRDTYVRPDEIRTEISVCADCMFANVNGEIDPDRPADLPEPWSGIDPIGMFATFGGTHNEECPNRDTVSSTEDCDCDSLGFSTSACEGCGDSHHGDRYRFTLWQYTLEAARVYHRTRLSDSRFYRRQGDNGFAADMRAQAAQWRAYIAFRLNEERAHQA